MSRKELKYNSAINGRMKKCYKCQNIKELSEFGKLSSSKDGYKYDCKSCRKEYNAANSEKIREKNKEYYEANKEALLTKNKEYREKNIDAINIQRKEYRNREDVKQHRQQKNKEYLPIRKESIKARRQNDINFRVSEILRSKFNREIKRNKYSEFLGCTIEFFQKWIEYNFENDMNWSNIGKVWHIDHILPINRFDLTDTNNIKICYHWTNLQPLLAKDNMSKSDNILPYQYFNNLVTVFRFNKVHRQYMGYQAVNESLQWLRKTNSGMVKRSRMKIDLSKRKDHKETLVSLEMDNPQPSSYGRNDKTMEKVQRLNGFGSERFNLPL